MRRSTYQSTAAAVLPSVLFRGSVLGLLYGAFLTVALLGAIVEGGETTVQLVDQFGLATQAGLVAVAGTGFALPLVAVVTLSFVDYSRRQYVLGEDELIERRGVFSVRETVVPYDRIEDVTFLRSRLQRFYGVGTVRINDIEMEEAGEDEELRVRYVENPEMFYSELRSAVIDAGAANEAVPPVEEAPFAEDISSLSGDRLATDTSSPSLMPRAVLHPQPQHAALFGTLVGTAFSIVAVPWLLFGSLLVLGAFVPTVFGGIAGVGLLSFVGFVGVVAVRYYRAYDATQYELFDDHVRKCTPGERTTVQFADVDEVTRPGTGRGNVRLWEWGETGHVGLLAADGETLLVLEYVDSPEDVEEHVKTLVDATE